MTSNVTDRSAAQNPVERLLASFDPFKLLIAIALGCLALMVLWIARNHVVRPFDNLVTEQVCRGHAEEIERTLIDFERSNRFGLINRTEGFCRFGPGSEGEPPITLTIDETEPGPLYTLAKAIGIILQFGIASIFLRLTVDPTLELYRAVRSRLG